MTDAATLQTRLTEARDALHQLAIGKRVVSIGHDHREMKFTPANMGTLRAYIADLESQLKALGVLTTGGRAMRRRAYF